MSFPSAFVNLFSRLTRTNADWTDNTTAVAAAAAAATTDTMRLRIRIMRNELPPANTLWPVSDTQKSQTIAQLLDAVNKSFPLEAEQWGLEDYVVTVGGYEALHYHELGAVCKDEDEVVIRPLTYAEVRARTLLGRAQITPDGRKLADGVAFGRPALRQPVRPDITIPPRQKKRALAQAGDEEETGTKRVRFSAPGDEENLQGYVEGPLLENHQTQLPVSEEDDDDDESDEDFTLIEEIDGKEVTSSSSSPAEEFSDDSSSDGSSADSSSDGSSDNSNSEGELDGNDSSSDSSSDDSSNAPSWDGIDSSKTTNGQVTASVNSAEQPIAGTSLPHQGNNNTKKRNNRRRDSKRLNSLKAQGILHQTATMSDLHDWQEGNYVKPDAASVTGDSATTGAVSISDEDLVQSVIDDGEQLELAARRQQLLADIASGGVEIGHGKRHREDDDEDGAPEELTSKRADTGAFAPAINEETATTTGSSDAKSSRPGRPSAAHRMIYSGLGIRAPEDEEQRNALRKTLAVRRGPAARAAEKLIPVPELTPLEKLEKSMQEFPEDEEDPDWWKSKINLMAVECVDEGVTLSAPPFPFVQYWDPQYQHKQEQPEPRRRKTSKREDMNASAYAEKQKRRGKKDPTTRHAYTSEFHQPNSDGDYLDNDDDENWEEGALLDDNSEREQVHDAAAQQLQDEASVTVPLKDFPELPKDITTLAPLTEDTAQDNDIITFTVLDCSASTNWQPKMHSRTVQLMNKCDDGWKVKVALRDLPPKQYDENGNRVYDKFEKIDIDDADPDDGDNAGNDVDAEERLDVVQWQEMSEPRLLHR